MKHQTSCRTNTKVRQDRRQYYDKTSFTKMSNMLFTSVSRTEANTYSHQVTELENVDFVHTAYCMNL